MRTSSVPPLPAFVPVSVRIVEHAPGELLPIEADLPNGVRLRILTAKTPADTQVAAPSPTIEKVNGGVPWIPAQWRHRGFPMIPNGWSSESCHVGLRFAHYRHRGRKTLPRPWAQRMCYGSHDHSSAERSELGQIDRSRRRGRCAGSPSHRVSNGRA